MAVKILLSLIAIGLAGVLVVSATMGAETLVPNRDDESAKTTPKTTVAGKRGKPQLLPTKLSPLTVKGTGFQPGENVTVRTADGLSKAVRRVKANAQGGFVARLSGGGDQCSGVLVTAVGDKGSRTSFQLSQFLCAAPGTGS